MKKIKNKKAFSVIEIMLASALFLVMAISISSLLAQTYSSSRLGNEQSIATQYAAEGLDAVRSIKNQSFSSLINTTGSGVAVSGGVWTFSGTSTVLDGEYVRTIAITDVYRDVNGNIVSSGGTLDSSTKKASSTVVWSTTPSRQNSVTLTTYLTNWEAAYGGGSKGMLVYADGGTTSDVVRYRLFDGTNWSATSTASTTLDVETTSTNRYARNIRLFASATRDEKIMIARHYNGTLQAIFAQVYDGTTQTWGDLIRLSQWSATTYLDVQNFGGTYLANGNFMTVFSDNTVIPKMRIWDGVSWSAQTSLTTLGTSQIPNYIVIKNRPGTNEVMAAFFTQGSDAITQYYSGSVWSAITSHATTAPLATKRFIDFDWSPNTTTTGALAYVSGTTAKIMSTKIWVANGSGGGAWGAAATTAAQTNNVGALRIDGRAGANEFAICDKDAGTTVSIFCGKITFSGTTATVTTPTNSTIATSTDTGIQKSYGMRFESNGVNAINVYSDNTTIPKVKKYVGATGSWDLNPTVINVSPFTTGVIKTVRVIEGAIGSEDMMVLLTDANLDIYSVVWDGTNNIMYSTPAGKSFNRHGINMSAATDYSYDFAWDAF
jgi:Tfp pilus assembly protein PilV